MIQDSKKRGLGQFFTKEKIWLKDNVKAFITSTGCTVAYDPFAGSGDLLNVAKEEMKKHRMTVRIPDSR